MQSAKINLNALGACVKTYRALLATKHTLPREACTLDRMLSRVAGMIEHETNADTYQLFQYYSRAACEPLIRYAEFTPADSV